MANKYKNKISLLFLTILLFLSFPYSVYTQDSDNPFERIKEYMQQRMYPYDTLSRYGYANAIQQEKNLIQNSGYMLQSPISWVSRGPTPGEYNDGYGHTGYISGRAEFVKIDPDHTNIIYIGGSDGGVWRTTDYGTTWSCITPYIECNASGAFAIDNTTNPRTLYYGTGQKVHYEYQFYGLGLFKSTDEGTTWTWIHGSAAGLPELTYFYQIAIDPNNHNHLLAALGQQYNTNFSLNPGLYSSTNGGLNWTCLVQDLVCTDVAFSPDGTKAYCVGPHANSQYFYDRGTEYRISTDGGMTFSRPRNDIIQCYSETKIAICRDQPNYIYIITQNTPNYYNSIFKSTDGGLSFNEINENNYLGLANSSWTGYYLCINIKPDDPLTLYVGVQDLWKTTNGGINFNTIAGYATVVHPDFQDIAIDPQNTNTIYPVTDGGAYRSTDGGTTWQNLNATLNLTQFNQVSSNPYSTGIIYAGSQDNGCQRSSSSNSTFWNVIGISVDFGSVCYQKVIPNNIVGCVSYNTLEVYNGSGFFTLSDLPLDPRVSFPVISHPNDPSIFFAGEHGVWESSNGGVDWLLSQSLSNDMFITGISICNTSPNIMYAVQGYTITQPPPYPDLFKSTNGGQNWDAKNINGHGVTNRSRTSVSADPYNPNEIILGLSGFASTIPGDANIYKSTDGGNNWSSASGDPNNGGLPNNPVNNVLIYYSDINTKVYAAATDLGVYSSLDGGSHWKPIANSLPTVPCLQLDYNRLGQKLYVGTYGRGVWELDLGGGTNYSNPIIVHTNDTLVIGGSVNINYDIIVYSGGILKLINSSTINFTQNKKITVLDGGQIDASSGSSISFTSSSQWGGIEFQGSGYGTFNNCTFSNSSSLLTFTNQSSNPPSINFNNCTFSCAPNITNGNNVIIQNSTLNFQSHRMASILISGSNNVYLEKNNFSGDCTANDETGITVIYGNNINIYQNTITDASMGISISNSSPFIEGNTIKRGGFYVVNALVGIGLDNSSSAIIKNNTVTDYQVGITMYSSSPIMSGNNFTETQTFGDQNNAGLKANYNSFPKLSPTAGGGGQILDAGYNILKQNLHGNGIYLDGTSQPYIDQGYNTVYGYDYYLYCNTTNLGSLIYPAEYNCWVDNNPNPQKFYYPLGIVDYSNNLTNCGQGKCGVGNDELFKNELNGELEHEIMDPLPQPIIINYGQGIFDTIQVINNNMNLLADRALYLSGISREWLGNYSGAINTYHQVISTYKDSVTAFCSLARLLYCYDKMHSDTAGYSTLRSYYQSQILTNQPDTIFVKIATELATKTLVRRGLYPPAITEYENIISHSHDSAQILNSQLNIVETYMLNINHGGGNSFSFTGRLAYLKPNNVSEGYQKILELLYKIKATKQEKPIPTEFKISQNYPNPFNPTTKIDYQLPNVSKVTIKVYDILGKLVTTLVNNEQKDAGYYSVIFDGTNFASGVYFYRIDAGKFSNVKKMVLVK